MKISRELAILILRYLDSHPDFYFPFLVVCKEYTEEDDDFVEICPDEREVIESDERYQTFELWENLQDLHEDTTELMVKGFIEKITHNSLEKHIIQLAKEYRKEWKEELWESERIEEFGLNEFIGGKADAYEDCARLIKKYKDSNVYEK